MGARDGESGNRGQKSAGSPKVATMEAKLVIVSGAQKPTEFKLKLPTVIGRSRSVDLPLGHSLVSRQHCQLFEDGGRLKLRDLGSLNGTIKNGARITDETVLEPGDRFTVGPVTFEAVYGVMPRRETSDSATSNSDDFSDTLQLPPRASGSHSGIAPNAAAHVASHLDTVEHDPEQAPESAAEQAESEPAAAEHGPPGVAPPEAATPEAATSDELSAFNAKASAPKTRPIVRRRRAPSRAEVEPEPLDLDVSSELQLSEAPDEASPEAEAMGDDPFDFLGGADEPIAPVADAEESPPPHDAADEPASDSEEPPARASRDKPAKKLGFWGKKTPPPVKGAKSPAAKSPAAKPSAKAADRARREAFRSPG